MPTSSCGIGPDLIGRLGTVGSVSWDERDVMLYALSVGAAQSADDGQLRYCTENSEGHELRVLPTYGAVLASAASSFPALPLDPVAVLHAAQRVTLLAPIPTRGDATVRSEVTDVYDRGQNAYVEVESTVAIEDRDVVVGTSLLFVRGGGGFGKGPVAPRPAPKPAGPPSRSVLLTTQADQALLYRLNGDRNPLHSDPTFARRAGFDVPILHGLCTYGFAGRALLDLVCDGRVERFSSMSARFRGPVLPGGTLVVELWEQQAGGAAFRVLDDDGLSVLDDGWIAVAAP